MRMLRDSEELDPGPPPPYIPGCASLRSTVPLGALYADESTVSLEEKTEFCGNAGQDGGTIITTDLHMSTMPNDALDK